MNDLVEAEKKIITPYNWKEYVFNAIVTGLGLILPLGLLFLALQFILGISAAVVQPLTSLMGFSSEDKGLFLGLFSSFILFLFLFIVGTIVSSQVGRRKFLDFEGRYLYKIPFYVTLRDTVQIFMEREKTPFSEVVLIDCYGTGVMMTGFVTDEHPSGIVTVFVPTAPNPTNGCVYHVHKHLVTYLDCSIEETMRTIMGVGVGSAELFNHRRSKEDDRPLESEMVIS